MTSTETARKTPEPTVCTLCGERIHWHWNSPYSTIGEWVTSYGQPLPVCPKAERRFSPHVAEKTYKTEV